MSTTLFIFLLSLTHTTTSAMSATTSPPQLKLNSINNTGNFNSWVNVLRQADASVIPPTVTFFIPCDDAFLNTTTSSANFIDPLLLTYHIISPRFSSPKFHHIPTASLPPSLPPKNTLRVANNTAINDASITHPHLFQVVVVPVHGVSSVLDQKPSKPSSSYSQFPSLLPMPVQEKPSSDQEQPTSVSSPVNQVIWKSMANRNHSVARTLHFQLILCLLTFSALYFWVLLGFDCPFRKEDEESCKVLLYRVSVSLECHFGMQYVFLLMFASYYYIRHYLW